MRRLRVQIVSLAVLLAGCLSPALETEPREDGGRPTVPQYRVPREPSDFIRPTFQRLGTIAEALPGISGHGEPSIATAADGSLFVAFPGCDRLASPPGVGPSPCPHGPVFKSTDLGVSWTRMNREDGKLDPAAPNANGDNDVTIDAAGNVYASDLGGGIQTFASSDGGVTWRYIGNVVESNRTTQTRFSSDRNWMAAGRDGNLIVAWMGAGPNASRVVIANTTLDGGATWLGAQYGTQRIGWLGTVQFHPDLERAYIPFTRPVGTASAAETQDFELWVMHTTDAGRSWKERSTGARVTKSAQGGHWSGVLMAPAFDVTGDGSLVYAWSEEVLDPVGVNALGSRVRAMTSIDDGATWSMPLTVSGSPNAIMPWVSGGGGDRFSVSYYASEGQGDSDLVPAVWALESVFFDGAGSEDPKTMRVVVDPEIHVGNICSRGTNCQPQFVSDRTFLDFFETDITRDGLLAIAYAAESPTNARQMEIRFAIQAGGSPLIVPWASPLMR